MKKYTENQKDRSMKNIPRKIDKQTDNQIGNYWLEE